MTTTTEVKKAQLDIHVLNKRQYDNLEDIDNTSLYAVDPQFTGDKLLKTTSSGDIVESELTESDIEAAANAIEGVQINGTDLTPDANKKVNIPAATNSTLGVIMPNPTYGLTMLGGNTLGVSDAMAGGESTITSKSSAYRALTPRCIDLAVKVGVTTNANTLTTTEQTNTCSWIGAQIAGNYALNLNVVNVVDNSTILLQNNTCYTGGTMTALTVTCPTGNYPFNCEIVFTSGATATTIQWNSTIKWISGSEDIYQNVLVPVANKTYTIEIWYDGTNFCGTAHGV